MSGVGLSVEQTPNTYYCDQCLDLSCNEVNWYVYNQCKGCYGCENSVACAADSTQRRIQNTVRVSQSEYLENLAGLNVYTKPIAKYGFVNWNQGSDRAEPGQVHRNVPSYNASSTKTSITRMRPGSCSAEARVSTLSTVHMHDIWRELRDAVLTAHKPCLHPFQLKETKKGSMALHTAIGTMGARVRFDCCAVFIFCVHFIHRC